MKALLFGLLMATTAHADDFFLAKTLLSDAAMLRLVTCGAPPGDDCTVSPVRWRNGDLTIAFGPVPSGYHDKRAQRIEASLDHAIATINAAGSAIHLTRVTGRADITVRPTLFRSGETVRGEAGIADGRRATEGMFSIQPDIFGHIRQATILISRKAKMPEIRSVVLEEVMQTLGFRFDIRGKSYQDISIFAQWSNSTIAITGQDAAILRLYYPGK
jgi:Protein of unknown function (DUF2927)